MLLSNRDYNTQNVLYSFCYLIYIDIRRRFIYIFEINRDKMYVDGFFLLSIILNVLLLLLCFVFLSMRRDIVELNHTLS